MASAEISDIPFPLCVRFATYYYVRVLSKYGCPF